MKSPAVGGCAAAATFVPAGAEVTGELMVVATLAALPFAEGHVDNLAEGREHGGICMGSASALQKVPTKRLRVITNVARCAKEQEFDCIG